MEKVFKVGVLVRERTDRGKPRQHLAQTSFIGGMRVDKCSILLALEKSEM